MSVDDEANLEPATDAEPDADAPEPAAGHAEWVLQADAAQIAGCSVSAIRKWRREGVVDDRRTTTLGGLERVEVRLRDVIDRGGHRETQQSAAPANPEIPAASSGTVFLPLGDLQAMILNLGEAERRALESTSRATAAGAELQQVAEALARTEAALAVARSEADVQRRRVRDLEAAGPTRAPLPAGPNAETERLREQVVHLEARMAESRSEVDGQRRRIRELEARLALPPKGVAAAEAESARLREQLKKLEIRLTTARSELDGQRRRIRDLEARLDAPPEKALAAEVENERLREQVGRLESRMAESRHEVDDQRRRVRELEARLAAPAEGTLVAEAENERLRDHLKTLEARLDSVPDTSFDTEAENELLREQVVRLAAQMAESRNEVDRQRRRMRELEASQAAPPSGAPVAELENERPAALHRPPAPGRLARTVYDDLPDSTGLSAAPTSGGRRGQSGVGAHVKVAVRRWRDGKPDIDGPPPGASESDPAAIGAHLRHLYRRLQSRRGDSSSSSDDNRQWIADLAAYDEALVHACRELNVPNSFQPGDRLPAEERVRLTRDLGDAGLDVRQEA